jgi:hypothetical protein
MDSSFHAFATPTTQPPKQEQEHKLVMISLGDNIKITRAAFCILIAGIILSLVLAFTAPFIGPIIGLFALIGVMLWAYTVNCIQVGHCYAWAWILTIIYILNASLLCWKLIVDGGAKTLSSRIPTAKTASTGRKIGKK